MNRLIASLTIFVALFATLASASTMYTAIDLGTLGGSDPSVNVAGINSYGQVVGAASGPVAGTGYGFLWTTPGPMVSLGRWDPRKFKATPTQSTIRRG